MKIKPDARAQRLTDDVAKLLGKPPYDHPANICWNGNYFARWIRTEYGEIDSEREIRKQMREK